MNIIATHINANDNSTGGVWEVSISKRKTKGRRHCRYRHRLRSIVVVSYEQYTQRTYTNCSNEQLH